MEFVILMIESEIKIKDAKCILGEITFPNLDHLRNATLR